MTFCNTGSAIKKEAEVDLCFTANNYNDCLIIKKSLIIFLRLPFIYNMIMFIIQYSLKRKYNCFQMIIILSRNTCALVKHDLFQSKRLSRCFVDFQRMRSNFIDFF